MFELFGEHLYSPFNGRGEGGGAKGERPYTEDASNIDDFFILLLISHKFIRLEIQQVLMNF